MTAKRLSVTLLVEEDLLCVGPADLALPPLSC